MTRFRRPDRDLSDRNSFLLTLQKTALRMRMPSEDVDESPTPPESRKRLVWSVGLAAGVVLAATLTIPTYADGGDRARADQLQRRHDATVRAMDTAQAESIPHTHSGPTAAGDGHTHGHSDPMTKNSVSRSTGDAVDAATEDPTTARQATAARQVVAAQRAEADPKIVPIARESRRRAVPEDRYAMAGGCYAPADRTDGQSYRAVGFFSRGPAAHAGAKAP